LYESNGLELYNTLSYHECRELIDIATLARVSPADRLQQIENDKFSMYLDKISYNRMKWYHIEDKKNLWDIKKISKELLGT
jgi:hypothetical protein